MLSDCLGVFETHRLQAAPDGYPRIEGSIDGRDFALSFIPDTLSTKRLPQLWLSMVLRSRHVFEKLALTARPRGDDYVSIGSRVGARLEAPDWLPHDIGLHGADGAACLLPRLREALASAFLEPRVREIAFVGRRIHLLYRLSEGRRGMHLLFRECVFDDVLTKERLRACADLLLLFERTAVQPGGPRNRMIRA